MIRIACDLVLFGAVFAGAWLVYFALHLGLVRAGLMRGVGTSTVVLAVAAAVLAGVATLALPSRPFSSPDVQVLVAIAAPFSFIGFCGNYVLVGPVTVDRSITLSILASLAARRDPVSLEQLRSEVPFDRILAKRLVELKRTGNVDGAGGLTITPKGRRILALYRRMSKLLAVDFQ